jgi:hypothetical protein
MKISTSETFLERMLQQNKTPFTGNLVVGLRNIHQEKSLNDIVQIKEDDIAKTVSDNDLIVERMQKMVDQSLSSTLQTLEEMKNLAVIAMDGSLSNSERINLQKKMAELQFLLHENTSSLGLSLVGKSYEDIRHMKSLAAGFINSQDYDASSLLKLADECNMYEKSLHQDAKVYTWERNGDNFVITSYMLASKEEVASKKADVINNWDQFNNDMYFEFEKNGDPTIQGRGMMLSSGEASRAVTRIDKKIEKINKMQEEFSKFTALGNEEKLASFTPYNSGTYSSSMGDIASISYGYADKNNLMDAGKQSDFIIRHGQRKKKMNAEPDTNFIIRSGKEYVKIGSESNGKLISRDIWENKFKKHFSPLGEIEAYGVDPFGLGGDPYDFRIKSPDNELGKMIKKLDIILKDEISKDFSLFIGNFYDN